MVKVVYTNWKLIIALIFLLLSVSCDENKKVIFSESYISTYSICLQAEVPCPDVYIKRFVKSQKNKIYLTNGRGLLEIFNKYYEKSDVLFEDFLFRVLNYSLLLNDEVFNSSAFEEVTLNPDIVSVYQNEGLKALKAQYCSSSEEGFCILSNDINSNQRNTIYYYFSINRFELLEDCYSGIYSLRLLESNRN